MHARHHEQRSRSSAPLLLASALFVSACRTMEPLPLAPTRVALAARHYAGTPLTGPAFPEARVPDEAADVVTVAFRLVHLERMPRTELPALATRTRFIGATRGADPVPSSALLAEGARVGTGEDAEHFLGELERGSFGRSVELGALLGALPMLDTGVTVVFSARSEETLDVLDVGAVQATLSLYVARAGAPPDAVGSRDERALGAVLVVEGSAATRELAPAQGGARPTSLWRELIGLADEPSPGGGPIVVVLRSPFGVAGEAKRRAAGDAGGALVAVLRVEPLDVPSDLAGERALEPSDVRLAGLEALARCREELALAANPARAPDLAEHGAPVTLASAFQALDDARFHRSALLFLSSANGAELALDLALVADAPELASFVALIQAERGDGSVQLAVDWLLERCAYTYLASLLLDSPPLARGLSGVLLRHAGEVGRYPGLLLDLVQECADTAELGSRLVAENAIFLADHDPGARMRAFDWLAARGLTPAGFDPLAPADARRAALERGREAHEARTGVGTP